MADVPAHTARLIALFISCVLYGILLTTFVPCINSLIFAPGHGFQLKKWQQIKYPIVVATFLMFFVSTFSAVLSLDVVMDAFIRYGGPGGALEFYQSRNVGWKHWMLAVEDGIQVLIGDAFLIYRCYVLYDRNWRAIALPGVTWLGLTAVSISSIYHEAVLPAGKHLNDPSVLPFLTAGFVLTFATSVITTYLIIRRLVVIQLEPRLMGQVQPHILSKVAIIFFESGLLYTLSVVVSLGVYLTGSNIEYASSLAPISCNLLLIRVEGINRVKIPFDAREKPSRDPSDQV
ncbi:hypothetical protein C8J57DRAFT_1333239 [Mycena rebaudengoi]|nr:hypothetical protein C8J57DRAFT_1333239 [Mycena rebaudengoi]